MLNAFRFLLLVFCAVPLSACAQEATFRVGDAHFVQRSITIGDGEKEAAAADLNADGTDDLVIPDAANAQVTMYVSRDK